MVKIKTMSFLGITFLLTCVTFINSIDAYILLHYQPEILKLLIIKFN